jgi:hypothetical protein
MNVAAKIFTIQIISMQLIHKYLLRVTYVIYVEPQMELRAGDPDCNV